jgi:hypothetical protein
MSRSVLFVRSARGMAGADEESLTNVLPLLLLLVVSVDTEERVCLIIMRDSVLVLDDDVGDPGVAAAADDDDEPPVVSVTPLIIATCAVEDTFGCGNDDLISFATSSDVGPACTWSFGDDVDDSILK